MTQDGQPTVLVADDESMLLDTYELWLEPEYIPRTATDGEEALGAMDDTVEVVVLDRLMPGRSGDEVLTELRRRGFDCPVGMVTAVEPDFDIIELPFQAYLTKPVSREAFLDMVEQLLALGEYETTMQRLLGLAEKRATLEAELSNAALQEHEEYRALCEEYRTASAKTSTRIAELDEETFANVLTSFE